MLAFENVTRRYTRGHGEIAALVDVNFDVTAGETVGVLGGARSGKSTLVRLAAGIEVPDEGRVRIDGHDTRKLSRTAHARLLRETIGVVRDVVSEVPGAVDVVEFVSWPLLSAGMSPRTAAGRAHDALRRVEAVACAGARLHELSFSEHTRVVLAQAIVRRPRLLLVDEPARTLDPLERASVISLLEAFATDSDVTMLLTAGEHRGLCRTDRLASLDRGQLLVRERRSADVVRLDPERRRNA